MYIIHNGVFHAAYLYRTLSIIRYTIVYYIVFYIALCCISLYSIICPITLYSMIFHQALYDYILSSIIWSLTTGLYRSFHGPCEVGGGLPGGRLLRGRPEPGRGHRGHGGGRRHRGQGYGGAPQVLVVIECYTAYVQWYLCVVYSTYIYVVCHIMYTMYM